MDSGSKTDFNPDYTKIYSNVITCAASTGSITISGIPSGP